MVAALLVPGVASADLSPTYEVQTVTLTGATAGTFTLTYSAQTTGAIAWNASAADMETALEALLNVYDVGVSLAGSVYTVTFINPLGDLATMTADDAALTGTAAVASVSDGANQYAATQPELGDEFGSNVTPHGNYSSSTDFCLQCHSVHQATGDFALMRFTSVTAVCESCHTLSGSTVGGLDMAAIGTSVFTSPYGPGAAADGTAATRAAYTNAGPFPANGASHRIGATTIAGQIGGATTIYASEWTASFSGGIASWTPGNSSTENLGGATNPGDGTADDNEGGLYCASCHTPHGNFGQMVNNLSENDTIVEFIDSTGTLRQNWVVDYDATANNFKATSTGGGVVAGDSSCTLSATCVWASTIDSAGQYASVYGYKLLSAGPNHQYGTLQTYKIDTNNQDGASWCASCHTDREDSATYHNHDTGCDYCHGNGRDIDTGVLSEFDFPHTSSNDNFLYALPDALCVSCHTPGNLP